MTYKSGAIDKASIEYTDGSTYIGSCDTKGLTGTGKMTFVSGDIYDGVFWMDIEVVRAYIHGYLVISTMESGLLIR